MEILISKICGLCYGSNNAIENARKELKNHKNLVLYKEILHNPNVIKELSSNGATTKNTLEELNKKDFVLIRAHGEPKFTFEYLESNEIKYLDCTCPNVKAIHLLVSKKNSLGYKIIIIGKHGLSNGIVHPEVYGTSGWCSDPILIEDETEIQNVDISHEKYYLVVQTTFNRSKAESLIDKIKELMSKNNKVFEYKNTICDAQKNINVSSKEIAQMVDAMIVIGGKNSSNSKELYNNVSNITKSFFIENPEDCISLFNELSSCNKIGITAGASTMKEDILRTKTILDNHFNN